MIGEAVVARFLSADVAGVLPDAARCFLIGLIGEIGRAEDARGAIRADAEPVGEVVLDAPSEEKRSGVLVEEREAERRSHFETPFAVEAETDDGLSSFLGGKRAGELELLRAGARLALHHVRSRVRRCPSEHCNETEGAWSGSDNRRGRHDYLK